MTNPKEMFITGEELRQLRNLKGLKQTVVAKKLRISRQAYSKIECSGKIISPNVERVLGAFNYSMEDFNRLKNIFSLENKA